MGSLWELYRIRYSLITHSLDLRWSAGIWTYRVLLTLKIPIAFPIQSLDLLWSELLAERIIPPRIIGCSQVTLHIAQDLLSHSLFTRLILWSAEIWTYRILLTSKITIALAIHSLDPLDRGKGLRLESVTC